MVISQSLRMMRIFSSRGHFGRAVLRLAENLNLASVQRVVEEHLFAEILFKRIQHPGHHRILLPVNEQVFNHFLSDALDQFPAPGLRDMLTMSCAPERANARLKQTTALRSSAASRRCAA